MARPAESHSGTAASGQSVRRKGCSALRGRSIAGPRLAPSRRPRCCSAAQLSSGSETQAPRARRNLRGARLRTGRCSFAARAPRVATEATTTAWARRCTALLRAARRARAQGPGARRRAGTNACRITVRAATPVGSYLWKALNASTCAAAALSLRGRQVTMACHVQAPGTVRTRCGCEWSCVGYMPAALQPMI